MIITICNEQTKHKTLEYHESFWTGSKKVFLDGKELKKITRNKFKFIENGLKYTITIFGNQQIGVSVKIFGNIITLTPKPKWYEYLLFIPPIIPFAVLCVMSNSILLGALFGGITGAFGVTSFMLIRRTKTLLQKILMAGLLTLFTTVLTIFILHNIILVRR